MHTYGVSDAEMSECLHIISIKIRIEPATKTEREKEREGKGNINNNKKNAIKLSENGKKTTKISIGLIITVQNNNIASTTVFLKRRTYFRFYRILGTLFV